MGIVNLSTQCAYAEENEMNEYGLHDCAYDGACPYKTAGSVLPLCAVNGMRGNAREVTEYRMEEAHRVYAR